MPFPYWSAPIEEARQKTSHLEKSVGIVFGGGLRLLSTVEFSAKDLSTDESLR